MRRYTATPFSVTYLLFDILQGLLLLRFLFKLLGANAAHWMIQLLYGATEPMILPFRGIFADVQSGASIVEWSALVAIIGYALIATLIVFVLNRLSEFVSYEEEEVHLHDHHRRHKHA